MFKSVVPILFLIGSISTSTLHADCCQSVDVSAGWRRDNLKWKMDDLYSSHVYGKAKSHIHFNDINSYTLSGKARFVGSEYYIRLSAEYGLTDKGRAHERFNIRSRDLYYPIGLGTSEEIKRRSEVYDFNGAVGYPFCFFCSRLTVVPLVGFSFHRQHLRVKEDEHHSSSSSSSSSPSPIPVNPLQSSSSESSSESSRSSFYVSSSNPFRSSPSSNPFSKPSSSENIASALGLSNPHRTSTYRFTWYGFYLGTDIAYALDECWTLNTEIEFHFLDNCHRKRKSWTGVYFVDDHHKKGFAYGFNGLLGATYCMSDCWFGNIAVDFNWWKSHSKNDELHWKKVGVKIGLGYMF